MSELDPILTEVLAAFPRPRHAFAYGSGVFNQPGLYKRGDLPMLDFIFAVEDPEEWHRENLRRHRSHYSCLGYLGPRAIARATERLGPGVYFNTLVPMLGRRIKYGVTSITALEADLLGWTTLFLAGRMHKPVATLLADPRVVRAQTRNLAAAVAAGSLLAAGQAGRGGLADGAPQAATAGGSFSTADLLATVTGISYAGDVRSGVAEDPEKVARLVAGSGARMRTMLGPALEALAGDGGELEVPGGAETEGGQGRPADGLFQALERTASGDREGGRETLHLPDLSASPSPRSTCSSSLSPPPSASPSFASPPATPWIPSPSPFDLEAERWRVREDPRARLRLLRLLPAPVQASVAAASGDGLLGLAARPASAAATAVSRALRSTVRASSRRGAALSLLSAGAIKGARYVGAKIAKRVGV